MSALLKSLSETRGWPVLHENEVDAFVARHGRVVLFLTGDPQRIGETADVAVILPELMKLYGDALTPAIAARDAERPLMLRYRFEAYPALVFLARGGYLGAIARVRDWSEYVSEIAAILQREPGEPPPMRLPGCVRERPSGDREGLQ